MASRCYWPTYFINDEKVTAQSIFNSYSHADTRTSALRAFSVCCDSDKDEIQLSAAQVKDVENYIKSIIKNGSGGQNELAKFFKTKYGGSNGVDFTITKIILKIPSNTDNAQKSAQIYCRCDPGNTGLGQICVGCIELDNKFCQESQTDSPLDKLGNDAAPHPIPDRPSPPTDTTPQPAKIKLLSLTGIESHCKHSSNISISLTETKDNNFIINPDNLKGRIVEKHRKAENNQINDSSLVNNNLYKAPYGKSLGGWKYTKTELNRDSQLLNGLFIKILDIDKLTTIINNDIYICHNNFYGLPTAIKLPEAPSGEDEVNDVKGSAAITNQNLEIKAKNKDEISISMNQGSYNAELKRYYLPLYGKTKLVSGSNKITSLPSSAKVQTPYDFLRIPLQVEIPCRVKIYLTKFDLPLVVESKDPNQKRNAFEELECPEIKSTKTVPLIKDDEKLELQSQDITLKTTVYIDYIQTSNKTKVAPEKTLDQRYRLDFQNKLYDGLSDPYSSIGVLHFTESANEGQVVNLANLIEDSLFARGLIDQRNTNTGSTTLDMRSWILLGAPGTTRNLVSQYPDSFFIEYNNYEQLLQYIYENSDIKQSKSTGKLIDLIADKYNIFLNETQYSSKRNVSCLLTKDSNVVVVANTPRNIAQLDGLTSGATVDGVGVPSGTTLQEINGLNLTLSNSMTIDGAKSLIFNKAAPINPFGIIPYSSIEITGYDINGQPLTSRYTETRSLFFPNTRLKINYPSIINYDASIIKNNKPEAKEVLNIFAPDPDNPNYPDRLYCSYNDCRYGCRTHDRPKPGLAERTNPFDNITTDPVINPVTTSYIRQNHIFISLTEQIVYNFKNIDRFTMTGGTFAVAGNGEGLFITPKILNDLKNRISSELKKQPDGTKNTDCCCYYYTIGTVTDNKFNSNIPNNNINITFDIEYFPLPKK